MNLVISGALDVTLISAVAALARPRAIVRLHPRAVRLEEVEITASARVAFEEHCANACIDFAFVPPAARLSDFKLIAMDMDSTLINVECIDEIADALGVGRAVAAVTAAAMRGEVDFTQSLRQRVALLKTGTIDVLSSVYSERVRLNPGASELLRAASDAGLYRILLSGGFTYFTNLLKQRLNFDDAFANELEINHGRLTGRLSGRILDADGKADHVRRAKASLAASDDQTIVIGDGANDIPMMLESSVSIAYHAKPIVRAAARIAINHGSLATVLDFFPP